MQLLIGFNANVDTNIQGNIQVTSQPSEDSKTSHIIIIVIIFIIVIIIVFWLRHDACDHCQTLWISSERSLKQRAFFW